MNANDENRAALEKSSMMKWNVRSVLVILLICGAMVESHGVPAKPQKAPTYRVTDLGAFDFQSSETDARVLASIKQHRESFTFDTTHRRSKLFNDLSNGISQAYVIRNGQKQRLPKYRNSSNSAAYDMNLQGDIVGTCWSDDNSYSAVVWRRDKVYVLGTRVVGRYREDGSGPSIFGRGLAIDNRGQIITLSIVNPHEGKFFLLTPVFAKSRRR